MEKNNRGTLDIMKEDLCRKALIRTNFHNKKAAKLLGVSERTVLRMKIDYDIVKEEVIKEKPKTN